jgi:pyruvate dehydrogenase E2 component (dihydrolipoamide acetyltransferase)
MATRIVLPDAGQTTDEMLLLKWYVRVGDVVEVGDILADIETDKAVAELEAYVAGHVLALLAEEGSTVTTGETLLWVGDLGEEVRDDSPHDGQRKATVQPDNEPEAAPQPSRAPAGGGTATPAARTAARERGLALADIAGSGPEGCIVKRDVLAHLAPPAPSEGGSLRGTSERLSPRRRALAARLQGSVRDAPHFQVTMEVDMTQALIVRETTEPRATVTDVIVKATADALADFPRLNCRLEGDTVHYLAEINIGIAVSVADGLVVPVLSHADALSLAEVAAQSRQLIANARAGRLAAGVRGTFTVSNLGMFGVKSFTAIINPPEAAILAVGTIEEKLVLRGSAVAAVPTLTLTVSSDHRLIDGALAARFLRAIRERLEAPAPGTREQ